MEKEDNILELSAEEESNDSDEKEEEDEEYEMSYQDEGIIEFVDAEFEDGNGIGDYKEIVTTVANLLNEMVKLVEESSAQGDSLNSKIKKKNKRDFESCEYRRFICYWCDKRFEKYSRLRHHITAHVDRARIKCTLCEKSFTQKSTLNVHMLSHTGERPFKCHLCTKGFVTAAKLKKHIRVHTGEKPYVCKECSAKFSVAATLRKHKERHLNGTLRKEKVKMFKCRFCEALFKEKEEMKAHKREVHDKVTIKPQGESDFVCDICQKRFTFRRYLIKHMKRHTEQPRIHVCTQCDKSYTQKYLLSNHIQSAHKGTQETEKHKQGASAAAASKIHKCSICDVTFKFSYHLKKHMTIHTNLRPYVCTECNGSYKTQQDLNRHKKIHAAVRPHKCTICEKGFVATSDLKRHLRTHTGAKPYVCEVCHQGFSQSSSLRKHKEKKHPIIPGHQSGGDEMDGISTVQDILNWIGRSNRDGEQIEIDYP